MTEELTKNTGHPIRYNNRCYSYSFPWFTILNQPLQVCLVEISKLASEICGHVLDFNDKFE